MFVIFERDNLKESQSKKLTSVKWWTGPEGPPFHGRTFLRAAKGGAPRNNRAAGQLLGIIGFLGCKVGDGACMGL